MSHAKQYNNRGRLLKSFSATVAILVSSTFSAQAQEVSDLEMWRLDCGSIEIGNLDDYSDSFQYPGRSMTFTDSCYLIRNKDRYLLWDTGLPGNLMGNDQESGTDRMSLNRLITDQLTRLGIRAEQVTFVGISHYHYDHTGQAADFPSATLLVDRRDWEVVQGRDDLSANFNPWISGGGNVQTVTYDHDVFGDGTVTMLKTPGHTPGHRSLLVRLNEQGPVLLSGDAVHFRENWARGGVPSFNTSRAESLASMDRLRTIADTLGATLVIQHEPDDIEKLPAFPASSK